MRRARRFAAMFIGEDPEAPNYDPVHKIIRSPMHASLGPFQQADVEDAKTFLQGGHARDNPDWVPKTMGVRASLYPAVTHLEEGWWQDPARAEEIVDHFNRIVLGSDSALNLAATGLVTHAYLYTGDEKYKRWVLEYVDAWMDRIRQNGGIIPDNVGPTGKPGELRDGVWWGTLYGWNSYVGWSHIFHSITIAAECAHLLTGDEGYLELLRSQVQMLLEHSITDERGALLVPNRATPDGWVHGHVEPNKWDATSSTHLRIYELAHLYHASMSRQDYDTIVRVREGDPDRDWNEARIGAPRAEWDSEYGRFQYYDGKIPDWPEKALRLQHQQALDAWHELEADDRSVEQMIADNREPQNPVFTKVLTQLMLGSPQTMYHGGMLRATVRYFDADRQRPGLPADVAALVDELRADGVGIQLVNTTRHETRRVIIQSGAFGEHDFTVVGTEPEDGVQAVAVNGRYIIVELPPSTSIRLNAGVKRFVNRPSYALPWHADVIPVPFP